MQEFEISLDGFRLRGIRRPGAGRRCLALHGWLDNAGSFSRLLPHLPDWDLFALDLPGHGHSQWLPQPGCYHLIDGVRNVCMLLEQLAHDDLVLMGHSMGGALASLAAAQAGSQVKALILLDALAPLTPPPEEAFQLFQRALASEAKPHRRRYYASRQEALARVQEGGHSQAAAAALAERSLMCDGKGYYYKFDPRLKAVSRARLTEEQVQSFLRAILCPVQVLSFSEGILPKFESTSTRLACLQHKEWTELTGGHHLHLEQPEVVASAILDFLGGCHFGK